MKAFIAGDHYTVELMQKVESFLQDQGIEYENFGATKPELEVPLQEIIPKVAENVRNNDAFGILACGTGAGVEIGANKFTGIRASLCITPKQAEFARTYDDANILCLGSWHTEDPEDVLEAWFSAEFDEKPKRLRMIKDFDSWR